LEGSLISKLGGVEIGAISRVAMRKQLVREEIVKSGEPYEGLGEMLCTVKEKQEITS